MGGVQVASFHLVRDRFGVAGLPLDRWGVRHVDGLQWARLLGTGRDGRVVRSFDPRRRAMFAVWRDLDALDEFMTSHPVAARWATAAESWHVALRPVRGGGRWGGAELRPESGSADESVTGATPVVVVTRASVRVSAWRAFTRTATRVDATLAEADGLRTVVGIGEAPVLRLGTVSVWRSAAAAVASAGAGAGSNRWPAHAAARRDAEAWFRESMFVTFVPVWSTGTWSGIDPVAAG